MIDLHCHILMGMDDGPKQIEDSLALARQAENQGVTHIVCTPHHMNRSWMNPRPQVVQAVQSFQSRLDQEGINITLFPGQELRLHGEILENIKKGEICFYDEFNKYLLIEFPTGGVPQYTDRIFYELGIQGIRPVIAHPERNKAIQKNPEILKDLVEKGALGQVTAASLNGKLGRQVKRLSLDLIEANLIHVVASDAHHPKRRPFDLAQAYDQVEKHFGKVASQRFDQTARDLVNGDPIDIGGVSSIRKKKFLGLF
ncbi:tyrosine protein phosphatase [Aerococcus urinae]|uniref:tyrosine-protein phosphatase n=1 Tax=Aerococcus TaxID=1375 RepID=UPI0018A74A52|nr:MULTISPECIES: CpsB/CapC family capsule biosynthesis tyrosine phosphatase [Aerococcus]MCY3040746.1 tyrosine protein phosphatase [Aerococcus sp. Group 2]MDK6520883.1 tyrosine protein phosphatase [Aerococcus urinae]